NRADEVRRADRKAGTNPIRVPSAPPPRGGFAVRPRPRCGSIRDDLQCLRSCRSPGWLMSRVYQAARQQQSSVALPSRQRKRTRRSMFRPLSVYIGARYTRARRRGLFVSFISFTAMIGLALGVLVMIVVLSVMNGFDHEMRTRVLGMVPHATIESSQPIGDWQALGQRLMAHPQVAAVAPFIQMQGLLTHRGEVSKILVNAVDPEREPDVSIIGEFFREGSLQSLEPGDFGIVIGDKAARTLGVGVGDKVTFVAPEVTVTPAGVFPRMKRFTVRGIFHVGAGEIDGYVAMTHIADMARLHRWQPEQVQGLRLRFDALFEAPSIAWSLAGKLGDDFYSRDWTRTHGNLYQAIRMEKAMIGLLLLLIVAVAAFNIVSTLVMVVTDKRGDIAILRTLGATPRQIMAT